MSNQKLLALLVIVLYHLAIPASWAANEKLQIEVIDLINRPASDVVPLVEPFVDKAGAIKGTDFKIILKSTPKNLREVKKLISEIDVALRKLVISVSTDRAGVIAEQEAQISGELGNEKVVVTSDRPVKDTSKIIIDEGQQATVTTRVYSTQTRRREPAVQKIQVQEGQWAMIRSGQSIPVAQRITNADGTVTESISYKSVTSGFMVRPQLSGETVTLDIKPERASLSESGGGQIDTTQLHTSVNVKLGHWLELGATMASLQQNGSGILYQTQGQEQLNSGIFVKVDLQ